MKGSYDDGDARPVGYMLVTSGGREAGGDVPVSQVGAAVDGAMLPSQLVPERDWRDAAEGEIALRQALLEDAIACFQKQYASRGQKSLRLAREAEWWLFGDTRRWPFSFASVCDALGIDPAAVRRRLCVWRERRTEVTRVRRSHMVHSQAGRRRRDAL